MGASNPVADAAFTNVFSSDTVVYRRVMPDGTIRTALCIASSVSPSGIIKALIHDPNMGLQEYKIGRNQENPLDGYEPVSLLTSETIEAIQEPLIESIRKLVEGMAVLEARTAELESFIASARTKRQASTG